MFSDNTRISWTGLDADRKFSSYGYYTCTEGCVDSIHSNCDRQCNVCHNGSSNTDVFQSLYSVTCSYMNTLEGQVELDISIILGKSVISNCCFPSSLNNYCVSNHHIMSLIMIRGCIRYIMLYRQLTILLLEMNHVTCRHQWHLLSNWVGRKGLLPSVLNYLLLPCCVMA